MIFVDMIKALNAGNELVNSAIWKDRQTTLNLCTAVLTGIVVGLRFFWPGFPISDAQLIDYAAIISTILGLINSYLTNATSKKVGL